MTAIPPGGPEKAKIAPKISQADDLEAVKALNVAYKRMTDQLARVIVGQNEVIEQVLVAVFCRGHALLMGVPGLAKTLLVSTLGRVLRLTFKRVQFTPDLMPSDITGTEILEEDAATGHRRFVFRQGPVFTQVLLADDDLVDFMQEHLAGAAQLVNDLGIRDAAFFVIGFRHGTS